MQAKAPELGLGLASTIASRPLATLAASGTLDPNGQPPQGRSFTAQATLKMCRERKYNRHDPWVRVHREGSSLPPISFPSHPTPYLHPSIKSFH